MLGSKKGDAIKGRKIYCQARKIDKKPYPSKGTSSHKMQTAVLEALGREPAFCFIEKELRYNGIHKLE